MGIVTCRGITFHGTLTVQTSASEVGSGRKGFVRRSPTDPYVVGIDQHRLKKGKAAAEVLWLLSPEMDFTGTITATGALDEIGAWEAGFIQTITRSNRIGLYAGGQQWHLRLNTDFGALKDGQSNSLFYCTTDQFQRHGETATADVRDQDAPNVSIPLMYSGDPAAPGSPAATRLERTDGEDEFTTWLAVAHHPSRSVVLLAQSKWTVSWAGRFDPEQRIWTPAAGSMNTHHESDVGSSHPDLGQPPFPPVPFSMLLAEAEESAQIHGPGGWQSSTTSGTPEDREGVALTRWNQ